MRTPSTTWRRSEKGRIAGSADTEEVLLVARGHAHVEARRRTLTLMRPLRRMVRSPMPLALPNAVNVRLVADRYHLGYGRNGPTSLLDGSQFACTVALEVTVKSVLTIGIASERSTLSVKTVAE